MKLTSRKRLVARLKDVGKKRITFDASRLEEIKEAITKRDLRSLIKDGAIKIHSKTGVSRVRARKHESQKRKGRRKGIGVRKGTKAARLDKKTAWMIKIRVQRRFLKDLKSRDYLEADNYRKLYKMAKGGSFRSKRHIQLYLKENELIKKNGKG